jgi:16S rRNA U516 pseudouridylate synthase RsuA-like enzyme
MTSNVTIYPSVEDGPGVTQFASVTEYPSTTSGAQAGYLDLMTGGILLLMTSGGLLLV